MRSSVSHAVLALAAVAFLTGPALADIGTGQTVQISGASGDQTLAGGTLQIDKAATYTQQFTFKASTSSTIDTFGTTSTFKGKLVGDGNITFANTVGGGALSLMNSSNSFTGTTTINSGVVLNLIDEDPNSDTNATSGTLQHSQRVTVNGTLDVSGAVNSLSLISLAGSGSIVLGSNSLTLDDYDSVAAKTYDTNTTFSGVISGTGSLAFSSGEITLSGVNTLTGSVIISSDTMHLSGAGSIAQASSVNVYGTLEAAGVTTGTVSFKSLSGSGTLTLGANDLNITSASGSFTGNITTTGKLTLTSGTQYLGGSANVFGQGIVVSGGTLQVGGAASDITIDYNITNNAAVSLYNGYATTLNGVISGSGTLAKQGSGTATITSVQTYTGATTISGGTLKLGTNGSIASSSGVEVDSVFDLTESTNATVTALTGISTGSVRLGLQSLTITAGNGDYAGSITGAGTLTVAGGTQSLSGTNTFTGGAYVTGGKLVLVAGGSLKSGVTLSGGNLEISSGLLSTGSVTIGSLAGTGGTVFLGTNTLILSAASGTYAGTLTGTGGLTLTAGTEILSGTSTYTGTTTVQSGSLVLTGSLSSASKLNINGTFDASGAKDANLTFVSLAGTGTVKLGNHGLILNSAAAASTVFSGAITGNGGLSVTGTGTQILTGANTYAGGTFVDSGATLQIGNGSNTGTIVGDIADNGTVKFARLDSSTFTGVISGSGNVVQSGIGTTILTGVNTYTGTTTILTGTLQIGNGTTGGSIAATSGIVDNGTLAFNNPGAVSINTAISGTGNLTIMKGTVTLNSVNSYTGVTRIASGATLALTNTSNITSSSSVAIDGTLDLSATTVGTSLKSLSGSDTGAVVLGDQSLTLTAANTTFAGVISGNGGIILTGGTQTITGLANTYSGATTINGGTLALTGSIANSDVTVNTGGTLSGSGTVKTLTVASGGKLQGGVGATLNATGTVGLASGSTYTIAMSSSSDATKTVVHATGAATISGSTLAVASTDGTFALGKTITVLSADGGITGDFTTAGTFTGSSVGGNNNAVFKSTAVKSGNLYQLTVNLAQLSPALASTATTNQKAVAAGIDKAIAAGSVLPAGFQALGNDTADALLTDTGELAGEIGADTTLAAKAMFSPFLDALSSRNAMVRSMGKGETRPLETWITAYAGSDIVDGNTGTGSHKFRSNVDGVVAGAQWSPWAGSVIGGALSYGKSDFRIAEGLGKGTGTSLAAGVYGYLQTSRHFYSSFAAGASLTEIKTTRNIAVAGNDTLKGKLTAYTLGGRYETGVQLRWFTPYFGVEDQMSILPSYTEGAAAGSATYALKFDSRTYNAGRVELGLRHFIDIEVTPRWILTPDFTVHLNDRLAYAYNLGDGSKSDVQFAGLDKSGFSVFGAKDSRQAGLASLGADILFANGLRVTTHVDTAFTQKGQSFTGFAGVGYTW